MGWRKVLFVDHVVSALHHPKSRVVSGFGFCLFLSLLVFYVFAPVLTGSADGGVPPIFVWFSSFSSASGGPRDVGVLVGKEGGVGAAAGIDGHGGNSSGNPLLVESGHGEGNRAVKPPEDDGTAEAKGSGGKGGILGERNSTETRKPVESDGVLWESRSTETNDSVQQDGILRGTQNGTGSVSNKGTILEKNLDGSPPEDGKLSSSSGKGSVSGGNPEKDFSSAPKNATFSGRSEYPAGNSSVSSKQVEAGESSSSGKCDIFDGKWVRDERKPFYPPGSCPYIDYSFNCQKNGRPDRKYLKWRWQPNGCNIPRLNATDFLVQLQGKRIVFVGDSLNRNTWESLVCILRHSVANKKRVFEISGRSQFKTRGYYSFKFKDYDCSVDFVKSPFLVRESIVNRGNGAESDKLRLDVMDDTTSAYKNADIVVFNTGHWWTHEKTSQGINYYQEGNHVYPVLKAMDAYEKALKTWAKWVDRNINAKKTRVFFRGYSLTHFRGGQWNSGGKCHKETEPIFNETFLKNYPLQMTIVESVIKKMKTPMIYLNVSRLTDYRKDGHPSIYRKKYISEEEQKAAVRSQDCSHWCLPGIPDTWNELLYASLLMDGKGLWRN